MSIEKLSDCSRTIIQQNPFTQIANEIILHIKDNDAFRVYCYLQSKSREWRVIREDVRNICKVGQRKCEQILSYLNRAKLIRYVNTKDVEGKFLKVDIQVLNGLEFDKEVNFLPIKQEDTEIKKLSTDYKSTPAVSAAAVSVSCGNAYLLNKEITKKRNNEKIGLGCIKNDKPVYKSNQQQKPTSYVERNTQSDEFKKSERGDPSVAEFYLSNLKGIPTLKRYREQIQTL